MQLSSPSITPFDFGNAQQNLNTVLNSLKLLIALDSDQDASNGLTFTAHSYNLSMYNFDISSPFFLDIVASNAKELGSLRYVNDEEALRLVESAIQQSEPHINVVVKEGRLH